MKQIINKNSDPKALIHHISRLEGQLASVKVELAKEHPNCTNASTTLLAASRSFASLRRSFILCFLEKHYIKSVNKSQAVEYVSLLKIING